MPRRKKKELFGTFDRLPTMKKMAGLGNPFGRTRKAAMPEMEGFADEEEEQPLEVRINYVLDNAALSRRVVTLMRQFPNGSLPELVAMDWYRGRRVSNRFQVPVFGGRGRQGGIVLDFLVDGEGGRTFAHMIQGEYWHTTENRLAIDPIQRQALLNTSIGGKPVQGVVGIWENRILSNSDRDHTMQMALSGIEVGR